MEESRRITRINDILNNILKKSNLAGNFKIMQIKKKWKNIVGIQLFEHTNPEKLENSILIVNCDHPGWINNLILLKNEILTNISQNFNKDINIKDIKFKYKKQEE